MDIAILLIYLLPGIIAAGRQHPNATPIFLLNAFLGWTVLFWFVALLWASTAVPAKPTDQGGPAK